MYRICAPTEKSKYDLGELAKEFLLPEDFAIFTAEEDPSGDFDLIIPDDDSKFVRGRVLYDFLVKETGKTQDWGILVGVRPKKLYSELVNKYGMQEAERIMSEDYCLSERKIELLRDTYLTQQEALANEDRNAVGIYIGIPFCPTRCLYCSFTSYKISDEASKAYLEALFKEMTAVSGILKEKGYFAESIYIGGGTPTSLSDDDFERFIAKTEEVFVCDKTVEFTVECGRPDTINEAKLRTILRHGANRISINPQTMKAHTLELIGRAHKPEDIVDSYRLARNTGDFLVNMDLITGLPEESPEDFRNTLDEIIALGPENITVHTLAVKKASRLIEEDKEYNYRQGETVRAQLDYAGEALKAAGYKPYYLYRQKHMTGNFENVGYCKTGSASLYNIRIMEENQSIIALGAGGISKMYYPEENRLERIPNVSNYQIYIERIDEMIRRKEEGIL